MPSTLNATAKALWEAVKNCGDVQPDSVPAGRFTVNQMAKLTGKSQTRVRDRMAAGLRTGRIKREIYKIRVGRYVRPVAHYFTK